MRNSFVAPPYCRFFYLPLLLVFASISFAASTSYPQKSVAGLSTQDRLAAQSQLFREQWDSDMASSPETATAYCDYRYNDRLSDYSQKAARKQFATDRSFRDRLAAIATPVVENIFRKAHRQAQCSQNLSVRALDEQLQTLAESGDLIYTRYADDLFFSTTQLKYSRQDAGVLITKIYRELRTHGFSPNTSKTTVSPPGARKLVVGLAVDGDRPRLRRDFKQSLRMHLHYCNRDVASHATRRKFATIAGLQNYLRGLLSYAKQIEPEYGERMQEEFNAIQWPI
jgi:hypothetical protein